MFRFATQKDAVAIGARKEKLYKMIRFINTIEISPLRYQKEDAELPEISDPHNPEEWYNEWVKSQTILKLDFDAIEKGSYFVDTEIIDDENLQIILTEFLEEIDLDDFEDSIISFNGGIVLMENEKVLIKPMCCGDLRDISEWRKIFENSSKDWTVLQIGHPWVFYKKENGKVQFSDYTELNLEDFVNIKPIFEIDELELKMEFDKIKNHPVNFKNKVLKILNSMKLKNAEPISELIAGLKD